MSRYVLVHVSLSTIIELFMAHHSTANAFLRHVERGAVVPSLDVNHVMGVATLHIPAPSAVLSALGTERVSTSTPVKPKL